MDNVVDGYCQSDCNAFILFMTGFGILGIAGSTTRLPGFIVSLRVVEKRDKAASITLTVSDSFASLSYSLIIRLSTKLHLCLRCYCLL